MEFVNRSHPACGLLDLPSVQLAVAVAYLYPYQGVVLVLIPKLGLSGCVSFLFHFSIQWLSKFSANQIIPENRKASEKRYLILRNKNTKKRLELLLHLNYSCTTL
jgi:hypothetical protein